MEKDLIEYIAKSLVDDPSAVSVSETEGEKGMVLQLKVAENGIDTGYDEEFATKILSEKHVKAGNTER